MLDGLYSKCLDVSCPDPAAWRTRAEPELVEVVVGRDEQIAHELGPRCQCAQRCHQVAVAQLALAHAEREGAGWDRERSPGIAIDALVECRTGPRNAPFLYGSVFCTVPPSPPSALSHHFSPPALFASPPFPRFFTSLLAAPLPDSSLPGDYLPPSLAPPSPALLPSLLAIHKIEPRKANTETTTARSANTHNNTYRRSKGGGKCP